MYGSMASDLAIDSSDVDLSIVGLNFNSNKELMISEMRTFYQEL
jgi:DNA polymerase sigma